MKQRIIQLVARCIQMVMLAVMGWVLSDISPEQQATIEQLAAGVAAAVVAIGAFVVDVLIHKAATGGVLKSPGAQKGRK